MSDEGKSRLQIRMERLHKLGLVWKEHTRFFQGKRGKVDQDIVEYGDDELFEKKIKGLKRG